MKYRFVWLCWSLVLFWVLPVEAQKNRWGFVGGINWGRFNLERGELNTLTGVGIGGVLDFVLSPTTAVRMAPFYVQKGAKQRLVNHPTLGDAHVTFKATYLEVPFLFKYGAYAGWVRPYVLGGPAIGFNVSSKRVVRGQDFKQESDIGGAIKIFDLGAAVGGGLSFPVRDHLFFVEGRYSFSFFNIQHDPRFSQFVRALELGDEVKNRSLQILTGVSLLL